MNKPLLLMMFACLVVIVGLVAGLFTDSIQRALTLPQVHATGMGMTSPTPPTPVVTKTPTNGTGTAGGVATIVAQDSFQRPNQALWGTASDGRTWEGDANTQATFSVVGMMGQIANGQGGLNAVLGAVTTNAEVVMTGSINHYKGTAVNLGVVLRWTNTNNWYKLLIDATHLTLLKRLNGVSSTLATLPFQAKDGVSYTLRFRAVGAMLFAKAWPSASVEPVTWMLFATDMSLTAGQAGIRVLVQPTTIVHITSFLATEATSDM